MLRLLQDLSTRQHWPLQLTVGHCDHRVRPDSADNAAHVQQCCQGLGLPFMQAVADRQQGHWSEVSDTQVVKSGSKHVQTAWAAVCMSPSVVFGGIRPWLL